MKNEVAARKQYLPFGRRLFGLSSKILALAKEAMMAEGSIKLIVAPSTHTKKDNSTCLLKL